MLINVSALFLLISFYDIITIPSDTRTDLKNISTVISIVLLVLYGLYNFFRYRTHADFFGDEWVGDYDPETSDEELSPPSDDTSGTLLAPIPAAVFALSSIALTVSCALVIMKHLPHVDPWIKSLYFLFILPVCLKSPLHSYAIRSAFKLDMNSVLDITIDGALRTLYLFCPLFVFLARIGDQHPAFMFLIGTDRILMMALASLIIGPMMNRGKSTFLDGALLLAM